MDKINYKDIITAINEHSEDKEFWKNCKEITDTIGYTIRDLDWKAKFVGFVWNYIMENTFLELAKHTKEFQGISFIQPETHHYFHKGNGNAMADFILPNGMTVETKKFKSFDRLQKSIEEGLFRWHNADYRVAYIRDEKSFYDIDNMVPLFRNVDIPWIYADCIPDIE